MLQGFKEMSTQIQIQQQWPSPWRLVWGPRRLNGAMLNERCTAWPFSGCFTSQCQCQRWNVFPKRGAFIFSCMLLKTLVPQTTFKARTGLANLTMHCPTFLRVNSSMSMSTPASQLDQSSEKKVQGDGSRIICCGKSFWKMLKSPRLVNFKAFCFCLMFHCKVTTYAWTHWRRYYGCWVSSKTRVMVHVLMPLYRWWGNTSKRRNRI